MNNNDLQNIELDLLLEAIFQRYGYDFRSYARASIERRVRHFLSHTEFETISELISPILYDPIYFSDLAKSFSITVTDMFRDPIFYQRIRSLVVPVLRTWPHFKVWHAGCATGEEVYSLAIMLQEAGLYEKSTIYATDFNDDSLGIANEGIYSLDRVRNFTKNYQESGGSRSFGEYYHSKYDAAVINKIFKRRVTFANHNLAVDSAFGEMHLIFCRNVLIYFDKSLQNRVLRIFAESLVNGGFLCLGTKEDLQFSEVSHIFVEVDRKCKIYKKVGQL